jgi:hypothetical protein
MECRTELVDVGAMGADEFVQLIASDAELFAPVGDVGGHFGVDLFGVVRALEGVIFCEGVRFVDFGIIIVVLGHGCFPL